MPRKNKELEEKVKKLEEELCNLRQVIESNRAIFRHGLENVKEVIIELMKTNDGKEVTTSKEKNRLVFDVNGQTVVVSPAQEKKLFDQFGNEAMKTMILIAGPTLGLDPGS